MAPPRIVVLLLFSLSPFAYAEDLVLHASVYSRETGSISDNFVTCLFRDSKDRIWVSTVERLWNFDGKVWHAVLMDEPEDGLTRLLFGGITYASGPEDGVYARLLGGPDGIAEGPPGTLWFTGTRIGVWKLSGGKLERINTSIQGYIISIDRTGNAWVADDGALYMFDGKDWEARLSVERRRGLSKNPGLGSFAIDSENHIWIGSTTKRDRGDELRHAGRSWLYANHHGPAPAPLYHFDGANWESCDKDRGLKETFIRPRIDSNGKPFFIGENQVYRFDGKKFNSLLSDEQSKRLRVSTIKDVAVSNDGETWIITDRAIWRIRDNEMLSAHVESDGGVPFIGLEEAQPRCLLIPSSRELWIGTMERGVVKLSFDN